MSLFHKTLKDAEKLFEIDRSKAIKILEEHRRIAEKIHIEIARIRIESILEDYSQVIGELILSLEKGDMQNAHGWIKYLEKNLKEINNGVKELKQYIYLE